MENLIGGNVTQTHNITKWEETQSPEALDEGCTLTIFFITTLPLPFTSLYGTSIYTDDHFV